MELWLARAARSSWNENPRTVVTIYDVAGHEVQVLFQGTLGTEETRLLWDGRDRHGRRVSSGIYCVRVQAGAETLPRSVVLLR